MKIKFLGTAAAEGIPSLYCQCETCLEALSKKGRNIRTRCQSLIDDALLLDFGPDTYFHMITQEVRLDKIHHVLITHKHSDHFYKSDILFRRPGYACVVEKEPAPEKKKNQLQKDKQVKGKPQYSSEPQFLHL